MENLVEHVRYEIKHWWISLLIGLLAVVLGTWCLFTPLEALGALTAVFIISFFASGVFEIAFACLNHKILRGWGWLLAGGIIDLLLGVMVVSMPVPLAALALVYFVGFWIMVRSLWAVGAAVELQTMHVSGWGWLLALAVLCLLFSLSFIFSSPLFGGVCVVALFSAAMVLYGFFRIYMAFKLRTVKRALEER